MAQLFGQTCRWALRPPYDWRELLRQMATIGVGSLPVVLFTAVFTGGVLALQTYLGFARFRAESFTSSIVALSVLREVSPVLTALMVVGRAGSSIAAELGSMRATEQIDALIAMAVEPVQFLIVPRVVAGFTMLPILQVLADATAILGGRFVAVFILEANAFQYDAGTFRLLEPIDFTSGLIKAACFGFLITLIACAKGYSATGGAEGVGKASTRAVVSASGAVVIADFVISRLLF